MQASALAAAAIGLTISAAGTFAADPQAGEIPAPALDHALQAHAEQVQRAYADARDQPADVGVNADYCMVLHAYKAFAGAERCYQRLQGMAPGDYRWTYLRGVVQEALMRPEAAADAYRQAGSLDAAFFHAKLARARLLLDFGDTAQAGRLYDELLATRAGEPAVLSAAGRWYSSRGETDRATELLERAVRLDPFLGEAHYALAMAYRSEGMLAQAERHLALHRRFRTVPAPADPLLAEVIKRDRSLGSRIDLATEHLTSGRVQEAVKEYEAVLSIDPQNALAHVGLITASAGLGDLERAEAHYRRALEARPDWPRAHYRWGRARYEAGAQEAAVELLSRAVAADPHHADAHVYLGLALQQTGQPEDAIAAYRRAIEISPGHRAAHLYLGTQLWRSDDREAAAQHFERVLEIEDERTALFHERIAQLYLEAGQTPQAIEHFERGRDSAVAHGAKDIARRIVRQWDRAMGVR